MNIDIRSHIFARVYGQCLKLLNQEVGGFAQKFTNLKMRFPPSQYVPYNEDQDGIMLSDTDSLAINGLTPLMNEVKIVSINITNYESNPASEYEKMSPPVLLIDLGAEEYFDKHSNVDIRTSGNTIMILIRLVSKRENLMPKFFESNPIQACKMKEALDYLLDPNMFRSYAPVAQDPNKGVVVSNRPGYDIGSRIIQTCVMQMRNIGLVKDKYITDYLFYADFYQQKERGTYAINNS